METDIDDVSNNLPTYSVQPDVREDDGSFVCAAASSPPSPPHIHVRISHFISSTGRNGHGAEYASHTICLSNHILEESSEDERRDFISSAVQFFRPIDAGTVLAIADEVIDKARRLACNLWVDITTVQTYLSDDDGTYVFDDEATYVLDDEVPYEEDSADDQARPPIESLKRKLIQCDESDRDRDGEVNGGEKSGNDLCCVICLEHLTAGTEVAVMPCNHYSFHDRCLSTWLERSISCPICRRKMSAPAPAAGGAFPLYN